MPVSSIRSKKHGAVSELIIFPFLVAFVFIKFIFYCKPKLLKKQTSPESFVSLKEIKFA